LYDSVVGVSDAVAEGSKAIEDAIKELQSALGQLSSTQDINDLYKDILNREGDVTDLQSYSDKVNSGEMTLEDVAEELNTSVEKTLRDAYKDILNREADQAGLQWYMEAISSGNMTIEDVIEALNTSVEKILRDAYKESLGREADLSGLQWYMDVIASGEKSLEQALQDISYAGSVSEVPGFATGGVHTGGWRVVGEDGPELEYTPPSRIYSNSDSSDVFDVSELVAEVRQLRDDMRSANYAIARNTQKTSKILEKFDYDGLPEQRII
jgi:hypothetical protein